MDSCQWVHSISGLCHPLVQPTLTTVKNMYKQTTRRKPRLSRGDASNQSDSRQPAKNPPIPSIHPSNQWLSRHPTISTGTLETTEVAGHINLACEKTDVSDVLFFCLKKWMGDPRCERWSSLSYSSSLLLSLLLSLSSSSSSTTTPRHSHHSQRLFWACQAHQRLALLLDPPFINSHTSKLKQPHYLHDLHIEN